MNFLSRRSATSKSALGFLATIVAATGLCYLDKIDGPAWSSLMQIVFAAFIAGETGRKFAKPTEPEPV